MTNFNNSLELSPAAMRKLGYKVIDALVEHFETLESQPFTKSASAIELSEIIEDKLPLETEDPQKVFDHLFEDVFTQISYTNHPRFFSFVPSPGNYVGALADTLASGFNVFAGHWFAGSGAARIEIVTINWLLKLCGFPEQGGGLFVSGGSIANLSAIATARQVNGSENCQNNVVYYSQQTHSSLHKGLKILGFEKQQMRPISIKNDFKIDVDQLERAILKDLGNGLHPMCIVGNAGTTNTGTVDELGRLSAIAKKYNLWFHIDGAYGAAAILSKKTKESLSGIELADSLTLDPHKWWFQPYEIGCLLVRDHLHLKATYAVTAEYLKDAQDLYSSEINFFEYGIQLTRSFRALKLYTTLKIFGLNNFSYAIDHGISMAEYTEELLRRNDNWEITSPAQLAVIAFRYQPRILDEKEVDELNSLISREMLLDGYALIITTILKNRTVLRMCTIHPALKKMDIEKTVEKLNHFAEKNLKALA